MHFISGQQVFSKTHNRGGDLSFRMFDIRQVLFALEPCREEPPEHTFPWGIPQLQSDWSLSCDHGLDYAS